MYPALTETKHGQASAPNTAIIRKTVSAIINDMSKTAIAKIEQKNEAKNQLIQSSYWYNPTAFLQNRWNACTETDYYAYKSFREEVQQSIDKQMALLTFDAWNQQMVTKSRYEDYLKQLK